MIQVFKRIMKISTAYIKIELYIKAKNVFQQRKIMNIHIIELFYLICFKI